MQANLSQISLLVIDLLKDSPPELAARLKQRLNTSLLDLGFDRFHEKSFGHKRFKDFLYKHFAEILTLVPPAGEGDILVSLKESPAAITAENEPVQVDVVHSLEKRVVRSDVWQAFLNQDEERRRYLSKLDGKVVHYRNGEPAAIKAAVEADRSNYAEIRPIAEKTQQDWFNAFLQEHPPNARIAEKIRPLLEGQLTGTMIEGISHMLGASGNTWRSRRARYIYEHIVQWCTEHGVDPATISSPPKVAAHQPDVSSSGSVAAAVRKQAHAILDSLSDGDIAQIVLPILVSTVLVKARV